MTAFVRLSPAKNLRLVIIYPGVGYGTQEYVLNRMNEKVLPGLQEKVLIAVAPNHNTPWAEVMADVQGYANSAGTHLTPSTLIGWSGGANGIVNAAAGGHGFPSVLLADPSPVEKAFYGPNTKVWYNPKNWKGSLAHLGPRQAEYAQLLGDRAILVQLDHNQILDEVIKIALTERKAPFPPALLIGVPVFLVALVVAIRMRMK